MYNKFNSFSILKVPRNVENYFSFVTYFVSFFNIFIPALIYFYSTSLYSNSTIISKKNIKHLVPFIFFFFYYYTTRNYNSESNLLNSANNPVYENIFNYSKASVWVVSVLVLSLIYTIISDILYIKFIIISKKNSIKIPKAALVWSLSILTIQTICAIIRNIGYWFCFINFISFDSYITIWATADFFVDIFILNIVLIGFFKPDLYKNPTLLYTEKVKQKSLNMNDKNLLNLKDDISNIIETKKIYLNDSVTLTDLAHLLQINNQRTSYVINNYFNCSFYQLINSYRINYAIDRITHYNLLGIEENILNIAMESGFKNKSTFNSYFKQIIGETPSSYIKNLKILKKLV